MYRLLLASVIIFHESALDQIIASQFYKTTSPHWPWRDAFITEKIFHKGGVKLIVFLFLCFTGIRVFNKRAKNSFKFKIFFLHATLSAICSIVIISEFKKISPIQCPWNLTVFSGQNSFISLFDLFNHRLHGAHCFPAGHSSAAYAWISVYFSYQLVIGKRDYRFLIPGMIVGLIFGITQQMRGAHFFSHDLATILLCWLISGSFASILERIRKYYLDISRNDKINDKV